MTLPLLLDWVMQTVVAFISTIAFAIIFHTPRKQYIFTGLTGASGWLIYTVYMYFQKDAVFGSFFAALALTYIARIFSFLRRCPITTFLLCGIFPLVPGAGIYYTGYHIFMNDNIAALSTGMETIKIAIAIAIGIGIIVSLPPCFFTFRKAPKAQQRGKTS